MSDQSSLPVFLQQHWFNTFYRYISYSQPNFKLALNNKSIFPLYLSKPSGIFSPSQLHSMTNYYSPMYGAITDDGLNEKFVRLGTESLKHFDSILLVPLTLQQTEAFSSDFHHAGFSAFSYKYSTNWYEDNIFDFQSYMNNRPSKLKNTLKRKKQQMQTQGGFETRIYRSGTSSELMGALSDYHNVYYRSWKKTEPTPAFIDEVCRYSWSNNQLRIGILYYKEKPIAAQLWFCCGGSAYIFKLAHDEEYQYCSPGTVLTHAMTQHVIEQDHINRIDFLTGNDSYKQDWMSQCQSLYGLSLCNRHRLKGLVLAVYYRASRWLKSLNVKTSN